MSHPHGKAGNSLMPHAKYNLYRIDDILIKIGWFFLIVFLIFAFVFLAGLAKNWPYGYSTRRLVGTIAFGIPAAGFLVAGQTIRRRERRAVAVWQKLEMAVEVSASDLEAATGYDRLTIAEALLLINRRGNAFYVWDRQTDMIVDGRLRKKTVLVESCPSCGSGINQAFPLAATEPPACPYCGKHLAAERWNGLKEKTLEKIGQDADRTKTAVTHPEITEFRMPTFLLLLFLFWPAALVYALRRNAMGKIFK
jgi:hypothetical protein